MSDQLTEIQVSVARVEEGVGHLIELNETTRKRLDAHASDIKSLNLSLSRAKGMAITLAGMATVILGLFRWYAKP